MQSYRPEIEQAMQKYYATLSEKDQRRYAAIEALKLGQGGQSYIANCWAVVKRPLAGAWRIWTKCRNNPSTNR